MQATTEMAGLIGGRFRVGEWLVEPSLNRLTRGDSTVQLELRVMDVLVCLAARAGEVVPRHEIVDAVWATEAISDNTLTHAVTEIRTALGDDVRNPVYVETIHRRGYRLIAPVEIEDRSVGSVQRFPGPDRSSVLEDDLNPYPGLAAFTEKDARFFFGREGETAQMWRKLTSRRLLAVTGPSGVGKSSFLRAGVMAAAPASWGVVACEPGEAPFASLARALVPAFADDRAAIAKLIHLKRHGDAIAMVSRWRDRYSQALLIVDQCEELFTLNPPEIQARFAGLLRLLVDEADVHVLVGVREDFLHRCDETGRLTPVFDSLTVVRAPVGDALRRAVVEPAAQLGYAFEDEVLVEEILASIEGERGALPLVAFAVARLWDLRDRDRRLLRRCAYEDLGGVPGALVRHAESTLKALGEDRIPIARELFRNLVTAEGTRLVRSTGELLSVFYSHEPRRSRHHEGEWIPAHQAASDVLKRLCDARLLTCYEAENDHDRGHGQVELVHECLVESWPRLIAWRTQDTGDARYRDEFRQAARLWDGRDRPIELLWGGAAFNEFGVWRQRYSGGLCRIEEDFARAMSAHVKRRKRRRRLAVAAVALTAIILSVVFGWLWRHSVHQARRAQASQLLALGAAYLDSDPAHNRPSAALAFAIASLEAGDSQGARTFAEQAIWSGLPGFSLPRGGSLIGFLEEGQGLIVGGGDEGLAVYDRAGRLTGELAHQAVGTIMLRRAPKPNAHEGVIALWSSASGVVDLWSVPQIKLERSIEIGHSVCPIIANNTAVFSLEPGDQGVVAKSWPSEADRPTVLGISGLEFFTFHDGIPEVFSHGEMVGSFNGGDVWLHSLSRWGERPSSIGSHDHKVLWGSFSRRGDLIATADEDGVIKVWNVTLRGSQPMRVLNGPNKIRTICFDADGSRLAVGGEASKTVWLWDLAGPPMAKPTILSGGNARGVRTVRLSDDGEWVATSFIAGQNAIVWPVARRQPFVLASEIDVVGPAVFEPDGGRLLAATGDGSVRVWPMSSWYGAESTSLLPFAGGATRVAVQRSGELVLATGFGGVWLIPTRGGGPRRLAGPSDGISGAAFSSDGRLAASVGVNGDADDSKHVVWIWDLENGTARTLGPIEREANRIWNLAFSPDGRALYASGGEVLYACDLESDSLRPVGDDGGAITVSPDGTRVYFAGSSGSGGRRVGFYDTSGGESTVFDTHQGAISIAVDTNGEILVTGAEDGTVRVGTTDGRDPHVLLGHHDAAYVSISPDGKFVTSTSLDGTIRLWPTPDVTKPPLHTLPHDELIAKLKTLTNLRVVRDEESSTGWELEVGPFPGWETVPTL